MTALQGIRVLDLTQALAGPYSTMLLADMGADVIKVEPRTGEMTRKMGFASKGADSAAFLAINRNKRSVTVDLKSDEGRGAFLRLVETADVLVENFRPGVTERLGIDWETVHAINPQLIYASVSGFGQTGPHSRRPGFDLIAQGMAGIMSVTGEPGGSPVKCGVPIGDLTAGIYCALGVMYAYAARLRTGAGQRIDTSLFEAALSLSVWETAELWSTGRIPQATASAHRLTAPYQALRTKDGWITVGANNTRLWELFCRTIQREDLLEDPRFLDNERRMEHRKALQAEAESAMAEATTTEWVARFEAVGFPAGPIYDYEEVFEDPHTHARGMVQEYDHPEAGKVKTLGLPIKLSDTPGGIHRPPPLLGQHSDEVWSEVLAADELVKLRDAEVI